jgi:hypothetical protein
MAMWHRFPEMKNTINLKYLRLLKERFELFYVRNKAE